MILLPDRYVFKLFHTHNVLWFSFQEVVRKVEFNAKCGSYLIMKNVCPACSKYGIKNTECVRKKLPNIFFISTMNYIINQTIYLQTYSNNKHYGNPIWWYFRWKQQRSTRRVNINNGTYFDCCYVCIRLYLPVASVLCILPVMMLLPTLALLFFAGTWIII